jgi:VIT1/CCC1 family predicted Fe2+/Mn2+ transporter
MNMQDNKIIDTADQVDIDTQLKKDRKKYLIRIGGLIVFNTIMFPVFIQGRGFTDNLLTSLNANLIGFNIVGFIFGTIVAVFPYKGLPYSKKYLRASLLTILTLQTIMAVGLILIAIMTFLGWYPN